VGTTSVRPANLDHYVSGSTKVESHLSDRITTLSASYNSFQATSGITVANPSLMQAALPDLLGRFGETRVWIDILHTAVLDADKNEDGTVTIGNAELNAAMAKVAKANGIDLSALAAPDKPIDIDPPTVGPIPHDSGYVDDPVCTATGHFLEDEIDLAMPERLDHLRWARRYSSRQLDEGGHGRGWWTWASARVDVVEGIVTVVCPEGRHATFVAPEGDEAATTDGADVTLRRRGDGWALTWGSRSLDGPATWLFGADGRIQRVLSPTKGDLDFEHDGDHLVAIRHEGGRALAITWDGERIAAVRASDGREVRYRCNSLGDLVEVERALGGRTYEPDADGRIVRVVDADGVVLAQNRYDELGRVVRQVTTTGRVSVFKYEPGRRTDLLDTEGRLLARYEHDHQGRVERFVTPSGATLDRRFDVDGCVMEQHAADGTWFIADGSAGPDGQLRISHGDGRVEVFRYDHLGRVVAHGDSRITYEGDTPLPALVEGPLGWRQSFGWGPSGERLSFTDADGVTVTWSSDADGMPAGFADRQGNEVRVQRHPSGVVERIEQPDGSVVTVDVDDAGRPTRIVDATGVATTLAYTAAGRLAATEHPVSGPLRFAYAGSGFLERITDALGNEVAYERDQFGRATSVTTGAGTWRFGHSDLGVVTEIATPGGATWRNELDDHHRVGRTQDPSGAVVEHTYDEAGRLEAPGTGFDVETDERKRPTVVRDADGVAVRYEWTPGNRLAAVLAAGGAVERTYDEVGALVAQRDGDGGEWRFEHDWLGCTIATTSPEGRTTRLERDAAGRTTALEQGGTTTRFAYDRRGRLTETTLPNGARSTVAYDAAGRVVELGNVGGGTTRLEHDVAGRVAREVDAAGGEVAYRRDGDGNVTARTDQLGRTTRFHRDPRGGLTSIESADGSTIAWDLDAAGRVAAARSGEVDLARYTYGADGLLSALEEPGRGRTSRMAHTAAGRLAAWDDGQGVQVAYERVDGVVTRRHGTGLPDASWTFGPHRVDGTVDGRPVAVVADLDGATREVRVGDRSLRLARDAFGRIASAGDLAIGRDGLGRIVDAGGARYDYDEAGHLAGHDGPDGRTEWSYDQLGRIVEERQGGTVRRFAYDAAHQLVSITAGDDVTTFDYDARGRRVAERGPAGVRTFEWDGMDRLTAVVVDGERLDVDVDAFGLLRRVGSSRLDWDHAGAEPVPAALDGRALVTVGRLVVADGEELVASGLLGPAAGPSPWGRADDRPVIQADTGLPGGFGFAGLVWLGARIYDPATMQFLSPDPLPGVLGSSVSANPYHYADNDPVNRCDPNGLHGKPIGIDEFKDMKDKATSFQWGNLAKVGLTVAGAVVMGVLVASGVGLVGLAVAGAVVGATTEAIPGIIDGDPPLDILRDAAIGGAFGAVGGVVGGASAESIAGMGLVKGLAAEEGLNLATASGQEAADSYLPGGDGDFDVQGVITDSVLNTAGGRLGDHLVGGRGAPSPHPGAEDPGSLNLGGGGRPTLDPPLVLPNAGLPRSPGGIILPNGGLPTSPGGIILPNGNLPRSPGGLILPGGIR
jgi:RHS repeat-associated protein